MTLAKIIQMILVINTLINTIVKETFNTPIIFVIGKMEFVRKKQGNNHFKVKRKDEKCEDIDEYSNCSHQTGYRQLCAWKHGRCYSIDKCSQITDFWQCRNSYTRDRCQYVVNNVASNQEKEDLYIANVFNFNTCRNQDCVFNTHSDCPAFRNGRRCFFKQGECTQCSYQTNPSDCITTEKCTWQNSECQNIKCNQISSKRLCNQFSYCQYDFTTQQCQINKSSQGSHCYQNDIRSDPIKTKYNSFFGL